MRDLLFFDEIADLLVEFLNDWLVLLLLMVQHLRVLEVLDKAVYPLEPCVCQVANLRLMPNFTF